MEAVEKNIQAADLEKPYIYLVAPQEPFTSDTVPFRTKSGNISVNPKILEIYNSKLLSKYYTILSHQLLLRT